MKKLNSGTLSNVPTHIYLKYPEEKKNKRRRKKNMKIQGLMPHKFAEIH